MNATPIPDDIRRFILQRIPSVPYLEALLLLRDNQGERWGVQQVARRLYLSELVAADLLNQLQRDGIVARNGENVALYWYQPQTAELQAILDQLAELYALQLIAVSNLIHSRTSGKAQQLANAFVWRKEK